MKKINIIYWIFTILLLAAMGLGAIPDLLSMPDALAVFKHLVIRLICRLFWVLLSYWG